MCGVPWAGICEWSDSLTRVARALACIDPSGKFLYAPNRGHNSIAGFVVDAHTGLLTSIGQTASEPVPRAFSLDPEGKFLYAAGLESGRLAAYRIDPDTGRLQPLRTYAIGARPMWVMIIKLPG